MANQRNQTQVSRLYETKQSANTGYGIDPVLPVKQVSGSLVLLDDAVLYIEKSILELEELLSLALRSPDADVKLDAMKAPQEPLYNVPLAERISKVTRQINSLAYRVKEISSRVEL